jgi:hypothetical protein
MTLILVSSSVIRAIGYDRGTLTIEFNNGSVQDYHGVPWDVYAALMAATSKGSFYNRRIRGKYR